MYNLSKAKLEKLNEFNNKSIKIMFHFSSLNQYLEFWTK